MATSTSIPSSSSTEPTSIMTWFAANKGALDLDDGLNLKERINKAADEYYRSASRDPAMQAKVTLPPNFKPAVPVPYYQKVDLYGRDFRLKDIKNILYSVELGREAGKDGIGTGPVVVNRVEVNGGTVFDLQLPDMARNYEYNDTEAIVQVYNFSGMPVSGVGIERYDVSAASLEGMPAIIPRGERPFHLRVSPAVYDHQLSPAANGLESIISVRLGEIWFKVNCGPNLRFYAKSRYPDDSKMPIVSPLRDMLLSHVTWLRHLLTISTRSHPQPTMAEIGTMMPIGMNPDLIKHLLWRPKQLYLMYAPGSETATTASGGTR